MNMKAIALMFSASLFYVVSFAQNKPEENQKSQRIEKTINSQWTFNYFPAADPGKGFELPGFDDSRWPAISLPHTWGTYETTGQLFNASDAEISYWKTGWGWYRKHFTVNREFSGRKIFIEFAGARKYCKVWINGKYVGEHKGGYGTFDFDITSLIKTGEDNLLAVAVSNIPASDLKTTSDNYVFGGIYNDVRIVLKDNLFIPMQGSALHEGGTFITTPQVSEKEGTVRIQTWVKNDYPQKVLCGLLTTINDASGKIVQTLKTEEEINPGQFFKFDQTGKTVKNPHLWSPEDPYLYNIESRLIYNKTVTDSYSSPLGFRWFKYDKKENALLINGKKIPVRSATSQMNYMWLGEAVPAMVALINNSVMSDRKNFNFLRIGYSSNANLVFDLADKSGIFVDEVLPGEHSAEDIAQFAKEMIRRDRNHPGIMFWSLGENSTVNSKYVLTEDTTRILTDGLFNSVAETKTTSPDSVQASDGEQPAKIVLTGTHKKIPADRSSVVFINADIQDAKGSITGLSNYFLKWNITGPATLVGPPIFDPASFRDIPITNVVRSTGVPGKIHVSVSASGLVSGTFDIESESVNQDNSIIVEPALHNEGRKRVTRIVMNSKRLNAVPVEIKLNSEEITLGISDKQGYKKLIRDYISKNNPAVDTSTTEFNFLTDIFAVQLTNSEGKLQSEDYNYSIDHFNNCRLIAGYINSTKLPQLFKDGLRKYYSDAIITRGNEKDAGDEMNWLNWIPSGGTVVIVQNDNPVPVSKGIILTKNPGLTEIIAAVYPQFVNFSNEAKERALLFTSKVNPYVHTLEKSGNGQVNDGNKVSVSYIAEKGQPILVPLLKFISE